MDRIAHAREHIKRGDAAMKKNIFALKFSADCMTAANEYSEAAQLFGLGGFSDEAKDAWIKAGDVRLKDNDHFSAGRCYEAAGLFGKAAECFGLAGKADAAVRVLLKQAESDPANSGPAFEKVIAMYVDQDESKAILTVDIFRQYLNKIGTNDLNQYATVSARFGEVLKKVGQFAYVHKEILTQIIIALAQGDRVKANLLLDNSITTVQDWMKSSEFRLAEELVDSFKDQDADKLNKALKEQQLTFLRPEIVRLARTLKINQREERAQNQEAQEDEEDEDLR